MLILFHLKENNKQKTQMKSQGQIFSSCIFALLELNYVIFVEIPTLKC